MSGTGVELDAALLRLRTLVGAPSGDTFGMLAKACEEIERLRAGVALAFAAGVAAEREASEQIHGNAREEPVGMLAAVREGGSDGRRAG